MTKDVIFLKTSLMLECLEKSYHVGSRVNREVISIVQNARQYFREQTFLLGRHYRSGNFFVIDIISKHHFPGIIRHGWVDIAGF